MKFSCERAQFLAAVVTASMTAAAKSPVPALEGLLIEAGSVVHISGYDLKNGIRTTVPAEVDEPGTIVLNAKLLGDIIRRAPDEIIRVEADGEQMTRITSGASVYKIIGIAGADYPELPTVDKVNALTIQENVLKDMISHTIFAVGDNEARPVHTGELFETENGRLSIVAVDGFRLALRKEKYISGSDGMYFVVPGSALSQVEKIVGDSEDPVSISVGQKHILFSIGSTELVSRRLEGEFLNYKNSIPKTGRYDLEVDRSDLIRSVERVSLIISENLKTPVRCIFDDGIIRLSAYSAMGTATDTCPSSGDGECLEIGFNNKYLLDALKAAATDQVRLRLATSVSPCVIVPTGDKDNFTSMILPVRLKANEG